MADIVRVTWWDSYKEEFECSEVRYGSDLLWMRLTSGQNRHIPARHIRWCKLKEKVPCPEVSEGKTAGLEGPDCRNTVTVRWWTDTWRTSNARAYGSERMSSACC